MNSKNSFFIDVLRVVASQFVLWGHCFNMFGITVLKDQTYFPYIQNIGVVVLFVISGFLFANSIGGYNFRQYFAKRWIRIKVPYIGSMAIISILSLIAILVNPEMFEYYDAFNIKTLVGNIFMLQDYPVLSLADKYIGSSISITSFASARPFWTLAIEWWLFLFFGFFYLYLIRVERIRLLEWFIFAFLAVVPLYNLLSGRGNCLALVWLGGAAVNILYKK